MQLIAQRQRKIEYNKRMLFLNFGFHTRDSEQHFPTRTKGGDSQFLQVLVCECQECLEVNLEAATSQFNTTLI